MPKHWRLTIEGNVMSDVLAIVSALENNKLAFGKKARLEVMDE